VIVDDRWAHLLGTLLFSKSDPPQQAVLVANATGSDTWSKTLVAALRGGGWNVPTFIDEPARAATAVAGTGTAANALAKIFTVTRKPATATSLTLGTDLTPQIE
jgi:hypothetical protein